MGILSKLSGLFNSNNKNVTQEEDKNQTQKEDIVMRAEQKEGFSEMNVGENVTKTLNLEQDRLDFLPVIRNFEENDMFHQVVVNEKLGDNIGAFIARVKVRPNGRTGIDYVMKSNLYEYKITEEEVLDISFQNIKKAKLKIEGLKDPATGENMISISSQIGLATCILYDSNFIDKLKADIKADDLHVTIINSGTVALSIPNGSFEENLERIVLESNYRDVVAIDPSTYLWENQTLQLVRKYRDAQ
ncbi:hypothetical protein [Emticicia sp. C21]|uniref:hypothetical protein n=1 Tax=Emticicia sp. C21 TaxID=2302915 RepID=UPI000E34D2DB|nr:hypothetical protein [Emticicia sp. C21]RFS16159.1 hypothetical protein D0T08_10730 [Emticicia sp. C21]